MCRTDCVQALRNKGGQSTFLEPFDFSKVSELNCYCEFWGNPSSQRILWKSQEISILKLDLDEAPRKKNLSEIVLHRLGDQQCSFAIFFPPFESQASHSHRKFLWLHHYLFCLGRLRMSSHWVGFLFFIYFLIYFLSLLHFPFLRSYIST